MGAAAKGASHFGGDLSRRLSCRAARRSESREWNAPSAERGRNGGGRQFRRAIACPARAAPPRLDRPGTLRGFGGDLTRDARQISNSRLCALAKGSEGGNEYRGNSARRSPARSFSEARRNAAKNAR